MSAPDSVVVRPFRESDRDFLMRTWLDNYRYSSSFGREIDRDEDYYPFHRALIDGILRRAGTQVLMACAKDDEDLLYGFACLEQQDTELVLHYVYVKPAFRQFGVATALLVANPTACTHLTTTGRKLLKRAGLRYVPYLL